MRAPAEGLSIPKELQRREERLEAIRQAQGTNRGARRRAYALEQADYEAKIKAREEKTRRTGNKPRGKPPAPPSAGVRPTDQINLTDEDSRIMPATRKSFDQNYNAADSD